MCSGRELFRLNTFVKLIIMIWLYITYFLHTLYLNNLTFMFMDGQWKHLKNVVHFIERSITICVKWRVSDFWSILLRFMLYNIYPLKLISVYTNQINYSKYFKQFVSRLGIENKSLRIHYHGSGAPSPVHPLEVLLVEVLDGFPLEFKCRGDQPRLGGPGVLAQRHGACSTQAYHFAHQTVDTRASNEPSRSLKLYNHEEGPY